jgi:hypothetical protein
MITIIGIFNTSMKPVTKDKVTCLVYDYHCGSGNNECGGYSSFKTTIAC